MLKTKASSQTAIERQQSIELICLRLLARREHSRHELLEKLALRGYSRQDVEPVLDRMAEHNWQNDKRYAECFIRQRIGTGFGPLRIRYELQQRGVDNINMDALAEEQTGGWQDKLLELYKKKYDESLNLTSAEWLKRSRFLQQRGYSGEMIKLLFKDLKINLSG